MHLLLLPKFIYFSIAKTSIYSLRALLLLLLLLRWNDHVTVPVNSYKKVTRSWLVCEKICLGVLNIHGSDINLYPHHRLFSSYHAVLHITSNNSGVRFLQHGNGLPSYCFPRGLSLTHSVTHLLTWPSPLQTLGNLIVISFPSIILSGTQDFICFYPPSQNEVPLLHIKTNISSTLTFISLGKATELRLEWEKEGKAFSDS